MARYKLLTLTNVLNGRDQEFNEWYDKVHIPDVMRMQEVIGCTRYRLTTIDRGASNYLDGRSWKYLAVWELDCDDPMEWIERATAMEGEAHIVTDALSMDTVLELLAEQI